MGAYGAYGAYGSYSRQCRSSVRSEDLRGSLRCLCDKNHRDEDFCGSNEDWEEGCGEGKNEVPDGLSYDFLDEYFDDIYDEDCVERYELPQEVRRCRKGVYSKDLPGAYHCRCDQNHRKYLENLEDLEECVDDEELTVAMHYDLKKDDLEDINKIECNKDAEDDYAKYDPNCIRSGQGSYGGYGAYRGSRRPMRVNSAPYDGSMVQQMAWQQQSTAALMSNLVSTRSIPANNRGFSLLSAVSNHISNSKLKRRPTLAELFN